MSSYVLWGERSKKAGRLGYGISMISPDTGDRWRLSELGFQSHVFCMTNAKSISWRSCIVLGASQCPTILGSPNYSHHPRSGLAGFARRQKGPGWIVDNARYQEWRCGAGHGL